MMHVAISCSAATHGRYAGETSQFILGSMNQGTQGIGKLQPKTAHSRPLASSGPRCIVRPGHAPSDLSGPDLDP